MVPVIRRAIAELDPGVALATAAPFETFLERPLAQPRLNAFLLTVFAGAALALAAVGLFAVITTIVRQRTRELGIRLTLGATTGDLSRMVLRRGLTVAAAGLAVGLVAAVFANRLLVAVLYQVSPTDGATLAVVTVLLLVVAGVASFLPARLAARIDPIIVLRADG
jgi:ABC-type antimicrobial peptide transport system permease subunit